MTLSVRIHEHGGPDVLTPEEVEVPNPAAGEVRLRQEAIGLNYIDVYHRTGLYPVPQLPAPIGLEGAGVVEALGDGVSDLRIGDRVAYASPPLGAYQAVRNMPADRLVRLPESIDTQTAAAMMLQGMTVEYLVRRTFPVKKGMTVLFHAAAGGVGLIACQWLHAIGATVIGTVGSEAKAELAKAHGCHHTIFYNQEDVGERVKELTDGRGVPVVYDGVGQATWEASLSSLARRGMLVSFGNASGVVSQFNPGELAKRGSLFLTRPTLMDYTATRKDLTESANALFEKVLDGDVKIEVNQTYPLQDAARAHKDLEARKTTGSTILLPE
ncbi:quinone oxidoreductase family protein [Rhodovibrio salinarum]|uniref:Quinone oxidoreductase n=1 Tax=Rhodovibrio salinarum TaxID=1087 RepID=A0A934QH30_9PROT|nr:quinone oxidoreductase [Rhodovibrio salinarum]MBK1696886.1 quinone oxidoreductase [Rhodovibrio salinarum]